MNQNRENEDFPVQKYKEHNAHHINLLHGFDANFCNIVLVELTTI